jgi:uncharacterized protein (TIGR00297 family)
LIVAPFAAMAWRMRWLTLDGAAAAWIVGSTILAFGGLWATSALVVFFVTGTALTLVGRHTKTQPEHRGRGRDAVQVVCTGGIAALIVVAARLAGDRGSAAVWHAALLGSLAAAASDTWATEIGALSRATPRMITTWKPVLPGTSGGITFLGSAAGVVGASIVATLAPLATPAPGAIAVAAAGTIGMVCDSLLGATLQALFAMPDGVLTETPERNATLVRGLRWMTNPVVNVATTALGAVIAATLQRLL